MDVRMDVRTDVRTDVRRTSDGRPSQSDGRPTDVRRMSVGRPTDVRRTSDGRSTDVRPTDIRTDVRRTSVRTSDGRPYRRPSDVWTDVRTDVQQTSVGRPTAVVRPPSATVHGFHFRFFDNPLIPCAGRSHVDVTVLSAAKFWVVL